MSLLVLQSHFHFSILKRSMSHKKQSEEGVKEIHKGGGAFLSKY